MMTEIVKGRKTPDVMYIGIDLGTYRAAITASNGFRKTVLSVVGLPKDDASRKLLGKDPVFGQEALQHRLALNIARPLEKGVIRYSDDITLGSAEEIESYKRATKEIVKHVLTQAKPKSGQTVYGVISVPARASVINKQFLIEAAMEVVDSIIVVSEPFSVAYGLDMLDDSLIIDIGAGTVDICRMHGASPEEGDQITLTTAGDYVDELLLELIKENHPDVGITLNMARDIKEKLGFVSDTDERVVVRLPAKGRSKVIDITEECKRACEAIVPPIIEAVGNLISTYDQKLQARIRNNIVLAGGMSQLKGLDKLIEEGLQEFGGGKVTRVDEPVYAGATGALKLAYDMPDAIWKQSEKLSRHEEPEERSDVAEFEEAMKFFEIEKEELVKEYEDKFIAIINNKVVDSDEDFSSLAERVYKNFGYRDIYMPKVTRKPEVFRIPTPFLHK